MYMCVYDIIWFIVLIHRHIITSEMYIGCVSQLAVVGAKHHYTALMRRQCSGAMW